MNCSDIIPPPSYCFGKIAIVAVVYKEPEWQETRKCIEACNVPTVYIERDPPGVGSLSKAINSGFKIAKNHYNPEYVWVVTNVTFTPAVLHRLIELMDTSCWNKMAAVHPHFNSDHEHLRFKSHDQVFSDVPFVEFTAPLVRSSIFEQFPLDEKMPYVGFDMAWGYELRKAGFSLSVSYECTVGHTYIRHKKTNNPFTVKRKRLRQAAVQPTIKRLIELYGRDYKDKIQYHNAL